MSYFSSLEKNLNFSESSDVDEDDDIFQSEDKLSRASQNFNPQQHQRSYAQQGRTRSYPGSYSSNYGMQSSKSTKYSQPNIYVQSNQLSSQNIDSAQQTHMSAAYPTYYPGLQGQFFQSPMPTYDTHEMVQQPPYQSSHVQQQRMQTTPQQPAQSATPPKRTNKVIRDPNTLQEVTNEFFDDASATKKGEKFPVNQATPNPASVPPGTTGNMGPPTLTYTPPPILIQNKDAPVVMVNPLKIRGTSPKPQVTKAASFDKKKKKDDLDASLNAITNTKKAPGNRIVYDRQFLLKLRFHPASLQKPTNFHNLDISSNMNPNFEFFNKSLPFETNVADLAVFFNEMEDVKNHNLILLDENKNLVTKLNIKKQELQDALKQQSMLESNLNLKERDLENLLKKNSSLETKNTNFASDVEQREKENENLKEKNANLQKAIVDIQKEKPITYYTPNSILCVASLCNVNSKDNVSSSHRNDDGFLGNGTYGCVRLAFNKAWGAVAVKCMQATGSKAERDGIYDQIKNECRMLQLSTHINVVRVIGYTTWPKSAGIIMEYMLGGNLRSLLLHQKDKVHVIPPAIRLRFVSDISSGMTYMHNMSSSKRVTHGDLKVDNILLTGDLTCKISDFGGAHFATCTEESSTSASRHKITHTEVFLAPEALKNRQLKVCKSMDVYSFAMMLYMILTRKLPYDTSTTGKYLEGVKLGSRPGSEEEILELKETLTNPKDIAIIDLLQNEMKNCWKQNPAERPSIIDIRDCLQNKLSEIELCVIQEHICKIVRKLEFKNPCQDSFICQPINKFSPPHFQITE